MESYMKLAGPFLNYQLTVQDKKTWAKVEKKLLPWRIAVQTFAGKLFLFKSLFLVLILKRLSIIEEPLI